MKKWLIDRQFIKLAVYAFLVIIAAILFEKLIGNMGNVISGVRGFLSLTRIILTPFLYGFFIAYLFNPLVRTLDTWLGYIPGFKSRKAKRAISILVSFVLIVLLLTFSIRYMTPEIVQSFGKLIESLRNYLSYMDGRSQITNESVALFFNNIMTNLDNFLAGVNQTFSTSYSSGAIVDMVVTGINRAVSSLPSIIAQIFSGTITFAGFLGNLLIGLFVAFYMLMEKESYGNAASRFIYAIFKKPRAEKFLASVKSSNIVFERFIIGKSLDSLIIGTAFFVAALIIKLPYPLLLAAIIGVTNMIPFIGPFIGAAPVILIVFLSSLGSSVAAGNPFSIYPTFLSALVILILQQLDGNVIGPKILGDSTGLKPLEVIFAITVGGALSGIIGMFLGVPILAVIKIMIGTFVDRRYNMNISAETSGKEEAKLD